MFIIYHLGSVMNNKKINLDKYLNNRFLIKSINAYNFNLFSEMKSKEILKLNKYTEFINKTLNGSNENKKILAEKIKSYNCRNWH